jgi:hypothetical protein
MPAPENMRVSAAGQNELQSCAGLALPLRWIGK